MTHPVPRVKLNLAIAKLCALTGELPDNVMTKRQAEEAIVKLHAVIEQAKACNEFAAMYVNSPNR